MWYAKHTLRGHWFFAIPFACGEKAATRRLYARMSINDEKDVGSEI